MFLILSYYVLNFIEWLKDFVFEKFLFVDYVELKLFKIMYEWSILVKGKESEILVENINMDVLCVLVKNLFLSLKERIFNIDLSIEWLKCELILMWV